MRLGGTQRRPGSGAGLVGLLALTIAYGPAGADPLPQIARGLVPPAGFAVTPWAAVPAPTSLAFGPGPGAGPDRLYVSSADGNIYVVDDLGGLGSVPTIFATGLSQPLGVVLDTAGTLYAADSFTDQFGLIWGRVRAFRDTNADGVADTDEVVVTGLPNGRHNTNGMAFGPDGLLYVTNGNRTDDGIECGPDLLGVDCPAPEVRLYSGSLLRIDPSRRNQILDDVSVVATGMRNVYDVAFRPSEPSVAYIPMNGPDDPAADDLLYRTDVGDAVTDDFKFPSCLYNPHTNPFTPQGLPDDHSGHGAGLTPQDNLNPAVIAQFGSCPVDTVKRPITTFGGHVSANGLAFAPGAFAPEYTGDLFVAEWGNLWGLEDGHVSGHKIMRVNLGSDGLPEGGQIGAEEFATGGLPLDLIFGGDGAMYVADMALGILRLARIPAA